MTQQDITFTATRMPSAAVDEHLSNARNRASEAENIIAKAKAEAERLRAQSQREAEAHKARLQKVADEELKRFIDTDALKRNADAAAQAIAEATAVQHRFEALTPWLVDLVSTCLHRITGALDSADLTARVVQHAVADLSSRERLVLPAAPGDVAQLEQVRTENPTRFAGVVAIHPDTALAAGEMTLNGDGGIVTIGMSAQVEAVIAQLRAAVEQDAPK